MTYIILISIQIIMWFTAYYLVKKEAVKDEPIWRNRDCISTLFITFLMWCFIISGILLQKLSDWTNNRNGWWHKRSKF